MRALTIAGLLALAVAAQEAPPAPEIHKIYVPYEKLDEVLGTDKERVMVPYKEFLELWNLKYGQKRAPDQPPVPYAIETASYEGRVREGIASFTAVIEIEVYEEAWQRIPVPFREVAFESVTVDGAPGVLAPSKAGYDLVLRGKGRRKVEMSFVAGISKTKELASCHFGLPPVPLHKLSFRVPGKGTAIEIAPARATTTATEGEETVVLAFLGPQNDVKLTWRYTPEETAKEPPLLFSTDLLDVRVEEKVLRGDARFQIEVLRAPATGFSVKIPEGVQVLEVEGAAIKTWGFPDASRRVLAIALHDEVTGAYPLRIGFEMPIDIPGPLALPVFSLENAARERGYLRVAGAEGVGLRPARAENVFQVDLEALPEAIRGGQKALGFRFPALPWSLGLETERIAPRVSLTTRARLLAERRRIKAVQEMQFLVERAGIFNLVLELPAGITLTEVGPADLVDGWRETAEGDRRLLVVDLKGRRVGAFALMTTGEAPLELEKGTLDVPLLKVRGVDREEGTLGVFMDPGIKATAKPTGVIPMEPAAFRREDGFQAPAELPLSFAWRWRGGGAAVSFAVEARKPKVTCEVRYDLHGEEGRTRVQASLLYRVEYTGVETFRFRVPKRLVERLKVEGQNIREKPNADDPVEQGKEPTSTYTVTLQGDQLGEVALSLEYDEVFPEALKVNESRRVPIPAILPLDVERTTTWVAIRKSTVLKVDVASGDYEQIDPSELPRNSEEVFLALRRFGEPAAFPLDLTKHEYQPVADLIVRHEHLKTVFRSEREATTIAWFEILNNDRQFLAVKLPEGSEIKELQVKGKPERPRVGQGGVVLVPLPTGQRKSESFLVAIAYNHPVGGGAGSVSLVGPRLPAFEETPAAFQALLTWSVHYPEAWRVTRFAGNVEPAGRDARVGSWLGRAIDALGGLLAPGGSAVAAESGMRLPKSAFKDIVPTPSERESVETIFTNGRGDGELTIHYTSRFLHTLFVGLAIAAAAAAVGFLSRFVPPLRAAGAVAVVALLFLASARLAWIAIWNAALLGAALAAPVRLWIERRRAKA